MEDRITESKTDEGQEYLITGLNPTYHNVITATKNANKPREEKKMDNRHKRTMENAKPNAKRPVGKGTPTQQKHQYPPKEHNQAWKIV